MADPVHLTVSGGSSATWSPAVSTPAPAKTRPAAPAEAPPGKAKPSGAAAAQKPAQASSESTLQDPTHLVYQYDKGAGVTYFKVVDTHTGEVLRQVPSADLVAMAQKLRKLQEPQDESNVHVDEQV